jgi:hypothetical protein
MAILRFYNGSSWQAADLGAQGPQGTQGNQGYQGNQGVVVSTSTPSTTNNLWYNPNATGTTATLGAAGKNFIINGGMEVNQRNVTSLVASVASQYTIDRWYYNCNSTAGWYSQQPPWTTLAGFSQSVRFYQGSANSTTFNFSQSLETNNVVPLQGQTVTLSFYASVDTANYGQLPFSVFLKYSTGTNANLYNSGTSITPTAVSNITASTGLIANVGSWTRCTATYTVPSTATSLAVVFSTPAGTSPGNEFNITGVQLEANPVATVFSRTGGTYQGELAQCQRYYWRNTGTGSTNGPISPNGRNVSTTTAQYVILPPVTMRTAPTAADFASIAVDQNGSQFAVTAVNIGAAVTASTIPTNCITTGLTAWNLVSLFGSLGSSSYLGFTAEL